MTIQTTSKTNEKTQESQRSENYPDFFVYFTEGQGRGRSQLVRLGAAWNHKKGDGLSIQLNTMPVHNFDGSLVLFSPKTDV